MVDHSCGNGTVRYEELWSRRRGGWLWTERLFARALSDENHWQNPCLFYYLLLLFIVIY